MIEFWPPTTINGIITPLRKVIHHKKDEINP
jgi:hypothetical protein